MLFDLRFTNLLNEMDLSFCAFIQLRRAILFNLLVVRSHRDARNRLKQRNGETREIRQTFCETHGI